MSRILAIVCALLSWSAFAADPAPSLTIEGAVSQPLHLTVADLKQTSGIEVDASCQATGGVENVSYVGVSLLDLVNKAGVVDGDAKGARLRHVIEVSGRDGYTVVIAMGEIEPNLEDKPVLVAYLRDGQPVDPAGTVRLVVPGDHHCSRSVRDVATITVK